MDIIKVTGTITFTDGRTVEGFRETYPTTGSSHYMSHWTRDALEYSRGPLGVAFTFTPDSD